MHEMLIRINELSGKRKKEGLTQVENDELVILRSQYIQKFRGSMEELLLNTTVIDPIGDDVTPEKLKSAQRKQNVKPIW